MKKAIYFIAIACAIVCLSGVAQAQQAEPIATRTKLVPRTRTETLAPAAPPSQPASDEKPAPEALPAISHNVNKVFFQFTLPENNEEASHDQFVKVLRASLPNESFEHTTQREIATQVYEISVRVHEEPEVRQPNHVNQAYNQALERGSQEVRSQVYGKGGRLSGELLATGVDFAKELGKREPLRPTDNFTKFDIRVKQQDSSGRTVKEVGGYLTAIYEHKNGTYKPLKITLVDGTLIDAKRVIESAGLLPNQELTRNQVYFDSLIGVSYFLLKLKQ